MNYGVIREFKVAGSTGTEYTIKLGAQCNCPAFRFSDPEQKSCKHIEQALKERT